MLGIYTVIGSPWCYTREQPVAGSTPIGALTPGTKINVIRIVNGWAEYQLYTNAGSPIKTIGPVQNPRLAYVYAELIRPDAITPPPVTNNKLILGMNVIANGDSARLAISKGARFISVTFNPDLAASLRNEYPGLMIAHRGNFWKGHLPSWDEFRNFHGYALSNGGYVYGVNEYDQIDDNTRKRAAWDYEMWNRCRDLGVTFIGGGWPAGCPNIVEASVRDDLRTYYAPLVNAGMWLNQHTYSGDDHSGTPAKERIFCNNTQVITWEGITATARQTWWLEERERFYCIYCNFDPAKFRIVSDETGMDWLGTGSFWAFNYTPAEIVDWSREYIKRRSEPWLYNGNMYPSPALASAFFQMGDNDAWAGYDMTPALDALQAGNWGQ